MSIDSVVVTKLIDQLREYIARLEKMRSMKEQFVTDIDTQDLVSHRMHTAVEIMIDIATHIASSLNLGGKETAADVFRLLGKENVLSGELTAKLVSAPAMRNVLIHEYSDVDFQLIADHYDENLSDLKHFLQEITKYLVKQNVL